MANHSAMQAVSQPLFFTYLIFWVWEVDNPTFMWTWIIVNILVAVTIVVSRIYLGAHHIQDIVTGSLLGVAVGAFYCVLGPALDQYLAGGTWRVPLVLTSLLALLVMIHPNEIYLQTPLARFNQTISQAGYLVSATVAGCSSGAIIGSWFVAQNPDLFYVVSVWDHPQLVLLRFLVGPVVLLVVYVGCKKVLRALLLALWKLFEIPLFDPPYKIHETPSAAVAPNPSDNKNLYVERTGGNLYLKYASSPSRKPYQRHTKNAASWSLKLPGNSATIQRLGLGPYLSLLFGSGMQIMPIVKFVQYLLLTFGGFFPVPALFSMLGI
jgi:hypothetical protein